MLNVNKIYDELRRSNLCLHLNWSYSHVQGFHFAVPKPRKKPKYRLNQVKYIMLD